MNAWSHLPNAAHIDRVLADVRARPRAWTAAWVAARDAAWAVAWGAARNAAWTAAWAAAWDAAWAAAWDAARTAAWDAAWDACLALIAWDDAADVLALDAPACRLLAACRDHRAVLLLPAVIALTSTTINPGATP